MTAPAPASSPSLDQQVEIETPEQVVFSYTIAGIGSRAAAAMIDYGLIFALMLGAFLFLSVAAGLTGAGDTTFGRSLGSWAIAFVILLVFAIFWGYFVVFEALWDGQTPGKRRLGIRVVQDGGYSVSFAASAVRNLVRAIDMQPVIFYAVGITAAAISKSGKRLGDMLAGTIVVHERLVHLAPMVAHPAVAAAQPPLVTAALDDREYEVLERYIARRQTLDAEHRRALELRLVERFRSQLSGTGSPYAQLATMFEGERAARARGVASRGATGAAREQHAIVARNAGRWSDFASKLADAQRRGLRGMSEDEVSAFVSEYREVATDLARLRTASAGRDHDALFYVSRLVGAGHNLIYKQRDLAAAHAWRYVSVTVPREVRRSWRPILLAALIFFGSMGVTVRLVIRQPALAEELLPPGMLDRAAEGVAREKKGEHEYVKVDEFERPMMASGIIANNVTVTFLAFVSGFTAGIQTVYILLENGVSIGAAIGLYVNSGIFRQIGFFVLPHSVLELSAICVASGGAFLIAAAILLPGAYTRKEAFVRQGRRAIRLMAASTMMLLLAGSLEGLLSPRVDVPTWSKIVAAAGSALLMLFYFTRGRGAVDDAPAEEHAYSDARALISK